MRRKISTIPVGRGLAPAVFGMGQNNNVGGGALDGPLVRYMNKKNVILRKLYEPKDLRTNFTGKILRLRAAPSAQNDKILLR